MKDCISSFEDFPKKGVEFWDFTPLLENPKLFKEKIKRIAIHFKGKFTKIAAIEAKGFIIGSALAYETKKPLILVRKPGLIPGEVISEKFEKEYGFGEYQIKKGVLNNSDKVLIVYDILAGPGAAKAAINLVEKSGAKVSGCAFVIELEYLNGREKLKGYKIFSLVKIEKKNAVQSNKF
ncbi:MAG: adenine phosphoribosyltransferase [Nanoarchaeota archaeon]|nr:adenine phosphoribosyltransferase [Nanoarchaeota archaeon]